MSLHHPSRRRRGVLAVLLAAPLLLATAVPTLAGPLERSDHLQRVAGSGTDSTSVITGGQFISVCEYSHTLAVDPITKPGVGPTDPNPAHLHDFFGNAYTDEDSTPGTLRGESRTDPTTCQPGGDRSANQSAYWTPALFDGNNRLVPTLTRVYYSHGFIDEDDRDDIEPFPAGFSMIAGDMMAEVDLGRRVFAWSCHNEDEGGEPARGTIMQAVSAAHGGDPLAVTCPTDDGYTGLLRLRVDFPNCWDGDTTYPWSDDYGTADSTSAHMRYAWQNEDGTTEDLTGDDELLACPGPDPNFAGGPYDTVLPAMQVGMRWDVTGLNLNDANLVSDGHHAGVLTNGGTAHADYMIAWKTHSEFSMLEQAHLVDTCINLDVDCGQGGHS